MKYILLTLLTALMFSCSGEPRKLKGGTAVTVEGDTIEFYGGTITYETAGSRDIRSIHISE